MSREIDGIINVCKPAGMSSFACLSIVKKKLGIKKIGFLGTLDPAASGVLVMLCGSATKLNDKLSGSTKVYRSVFTFGIETDTLDATGQITASGGGIPTREQIEKVLPTLVGDIEIEVPKFSAVHIGGRRAYDMARRGEEFTAPRKVVNIKRFELLDEYTAPDKFFFEIECETGTYIRSLAKLLAQRLGTFAIASTIIRTRVGEFDIRDSKRLEDITVNNIIVY